LKSFTPSWPSSGQTASARDRAIFRLHFHFGLLGDRQKTRSSSFAPTNYFSAGAGCDPEFGVSGTNLEETMVNRAMRESQEKSS
jgi:hypothetical protein